MPIATSGPTITKRSNASIQKKDQKMMMAMISIELIQKILLTFIGYGIRQVGTNITIPETAQ